MTSDSGGWPTDRVRFAVPTYWKARQALEVYEFICRLECSVWCRFQSVLADVVPHQDRPDVEYYLMNSIVPSIDAGIAADWSEDEAEAVFGVLNQVRDAIWTGYQKDIRRLLRMRHGGKRKRKKSVSNFDGPF